MKTVVIVEAKRTAIGHFLGSLSNYRAIDFTTQVIENILQNVDKSIVDEVILGQVFQAGEGQNPARQVLLKSGISQHTPAVTINKLCGSGMKALHYAYQTIALGEAEMIVAGGMENMSQAGHLLTNYRNGKKLGNTIIEDLMLKDGLTCQISNGIHMGITAENLAEKYNISREEQDKFANQSQQKASAAEKAGHFKDEIVPIPLKEKNQTKIFDKDEFIKHDSNIKSIAKLRPAFKKDGTVTAANSSGINDGASVILMMSLIKAKSLGLKSLVKVMGFGIAGVDPQLMGIGPAQATRHCLSNINWDIASLDLIESNEAFAAQAISVNKELGWDTKKVNVNGSSIALGHPIGASGSRIVTTLIHEMLRSDKKRGLATMCIGGGQGIASAYELI